MTHRTREKWSQGTLLDTRVTSRWTEGQRQQAYMRERLLVFANFSALDEGRGRRLVASCQSEAEAKLIATLPDVMDRVEALEAQLDELKLMEAVALRLANDAAAAFIRLETENAALKLRITAEEHYKEKRSLEYAEAMGRIAGLEAENAALDKDNAKMRAMLAGNRDLIEGLGLPMNAIYTEVQLELARREIALKQENAALKAQVAERDDKIDGLSSDLDSAVDVAFKYGATHWVRLNYPARYATLTKEPDNG